MSWQPISTAPRDGRWFLLFDDMQRCVVGQWSIGYATGYPIAAWRDRYDERISPTHWMPLPKAPT